MDSRTRITTAIIPGAILARDPRRMDLRTLEEELRKLGITIVSGQQDTVLSVQIKGLAGKPLVQGLRLCDQLLHEKVKAVLKANVDGCSRLFTDPTFGPNADDPLGAKALCKTGTVIPSKGGSQHQLKVLGLLKSDKLRWERPLYADDDADNEPDNQNSHDAIEEDDDESFQQAHTAERVFASEAKLFSDGVCSGDVIQGNLGDCWFLSALSVVATRSDLLEQTFWRGDKHKSKGLFVCKFMKDFAWNYVIIDDRVPVYGYSKSKEGKPYFARCRDPNELWVALLEKAYAKLHGSYENLIGGFVDVALNDLTGMCSEQVIMKNGFPGFGEDPFAPAKSGQRVGDSFWEKLLRYKNSGTLMGCSIQPAPSSADKSAAPESSAGNGLYFKHAYALVDAAEIKTVKGERIRLVKLRNPWGMGEWTGPWSDSSDERAENQDAIEQYFKLLKRKVGGNATKRVFLSLTGKGELKVDEIAQEEVVEVNANDGTFFMSYDGWMQFFTHFFAGIDFPDEWHGRRVQGCWNEASCGGNTTKSSWINNPRFELHVEERSRLFISLSQEDPRGKENKKIVPVGFHICSLLAAGQPECTKFEIREPAGKSDAYYRLYKEKDRLEFKKGIRAEPLPPLIIPGSVVNGVDDDGVPQPAYTFKQAVSVDVTMETGRYCIIPSMYMRTDKDTGKTNVGNFWISVYSEKAKFRLEGGEKIAEEEEGDDEAISNGSNSPVGSHSSGRRSSSVLNSPGKRTESSISTDTLTAMDKRRRFEDVKDELLAQAKTKGIGLRELKLEFSKSGAVKKHEIRKKMIAVGFKPDELSDDKINVIFGGLESSTGSVNSESILNLFETEIHEDQMACAIPEVEDDEVPQKIHQEGILSLELRGAKDLAMDSAKTSKSSKTVNKVPLPLLEFSEAEQRIRQQLARELCDQEYELASAITPFLRRKGWFKTTERGARQFRQISKKFSAPVETFLEKLETKFRNRDIVNDAEENISQNQRHQDSFVRPVIDRPADNFVDPTSLLSPPMPLAHVTDTMRARETKRTQRLLILQKRKREAIGDHGKLACLPRLIGGRASGSSHGLCSDCGVRFHMDGRNAESVQDRGSEECAGSNCTNRMCIDCFNRLPARKKLCEDCFENEIVPSEVFGGQLRALLIDKIGSTDSSRSRLESLFRVLDTDGSGTLSADEFSKALLTLDLQPPLTREQRASLMAQFDTNKDGEISFSEFMDWVMKDHVWQPPEENNVKDQDGDTMEIIKHGIDHIVSTCINSIISGSTTNVWLSTRNSFSLQSLQTTVQTLEDRKKRKEVGSIIFQRVLSLRIEGSAAGDSGESAIESMFQKFDSDGSGMIDLEEFNKFLTSLGLQLSESDVFLLMKRLESADDRNNSVNLLEFRAYLEKVLDGGVQKDELQQLPSLVTTLIAIGERAGHDAGVRGDLQNVLQRLSWGMHECDMREMQRHLWQRAELALSISDLRRLANALYFRDVVPTPSNSQPTNPAPSSSSADVKLLDLVNSGDVLNCVMFRTPASILSNLKSFSTRKWCHHIETFLKESTQTSNLESMWNTMFGVKKTQCVDQGQFVDRLVRAGFYPAFDGGDGTDNGLVYHLTTKLFIALTLDAIRQESSCDHNAVVSFSLFSLLVERTRVDEIEAKFAHALNTYAQFCQGKQSYLVTMALDEDGLIVRARDPSQKVEMEYTLTHNDCSRICTTQLSGSIWPRHIHRVDGGREATFVKNPQPLVTEVTYPWLHRGLLKLAGRIRICSREGITAQHSMVPYLNLVESDEFVKSLRDQLELAQLPFFWSVSATNLDFSIDSDFLSQMGRESFQQVVAECLTRSSAKGLLATLKFSSSTLEVRYETIGKNAVFTSSWSVFQALLSGQQHVFAVIELLPQGDTIVTRVDQTGGNGAPQWHCSQSIRIMEPDRAQLRIDRAVVYTDTVKVSSIPSSAATSKITFSVLENGSSGHFVVLSVRRATAELKGEKERLYCTAYDPFTASDYAVEGAPVDWNIDFFNPAINVDFEKKWLDLIKTMYLGVTLTPKVIVKVFNKQRKIEKLIGECEVSVSCAIAHEGHIFDDWFTLADPNEPLKPVGAINLAFHFNAKKIENSAKLSTRLSVAPTDLTKRQQVMSSTYQESTVRESTPELKALKESLREAEIAKKDALEQARLLKAQLQQVSSNLLSATDESVEVAKWKKKFDQVRAEHEALQLEQRRRTTELQDELARLRETQAPKSPVINPTKAVITSFKNAGLGEEASVHDILGTMKDILMGRSADRPYNGLKKALAVVADPPGKVSIPAFHDVLDDFGLGLSKPHREELLAILDPENQGRISIEDFLIKLSGDAELLASIRPPDSRILHTHPTTPREPTTKGGNVPELRLPVPASVSPPRPQSSTVPAPSRPAKMSWKEMRKYLMLNIPDGWETRFTEKGRPYFCNHANRSTQWKHPVSEVETKYSEWVKENGANFLRLSTTAKK